MRKKSRKNRKKSERKLKMNEKLPYLLNVAKWQQQLFYNIDTT